MSWNDNKSNPDFAPVQARCRTGSDALYNCQTQPVTNTCSPAHACGHACMHALWHIAVPTRTFNTSGGSSWLGCCFCVCHVMSFVAMPDLCSGCDLRGPPLATETDVTLEGR